jgi:hypothetical protein
MGRLALMVRLAQPARQELGSRGPLVQQERRARQALLVLAPLEQQEPPDLKAQQVLLGLLGPQALLGPQVLAPLEQRAQ